MKQYHNTINFDKWAYLAKSDPKAFELCRSQFLKNALQHIDKNKRHKFECLQWRIDQIRLTTKTPLSACVKISQLMWTSFEELHRQYHDDYQDLVSLTPQKTATVLPFKTS